MIKNSRIKRMPQRGGGSIHYLKDFKTFEPFIGEKGWNAPIKELLAVYKQKDNIFSITSSRQKNNRKNQKLEEFKRD